MLLALAGVAMLATGRPQPRCVKTVKVVTGDDPEGNRFFSKRRVTIREGSCVRWVWTGTLDHQSRARAFTQHLLSMRMRVRVLPR